VPVTEVNLDPDYLLVQRVQSGNLDAFDVLVAKYKQPIVRFATRTLRDAAEAQDVAQNVFVLMFKACGRFRFTCRFSTWLYTITRNLCRNELRRRSRHRADFLRHEEIEAQEFERWHLGKAKFGTVPGAVLQKELEEKIEQALELLSERERTAILLLQHEDLSYADVAEVLGTSHSATKTLIHRGRQTLKRELQPYLRSGAGRASWSEVAA
jgi:RNA polymerase sigma-70 factor, ECF subfamily